MIAGPSRLLSCRPRRLDVPWSADVAACSPGDALTRAANSGSTSTSSGLTGSNPSGLSPLLIPHPPRTDVQPQRSAADYTASRHAAHVSASEQLAGGAVRKIFRPALQKTYETRDHPCGNRVLGYEKGRAPLSGYPRGVQGRARGRFIYSPLAYGGNTSRVARRAAVPLDLVSPRSSVSADADPVALRHGMNRCLLMRGSLNSIRVLAIALLAGQLRASFAECSPSIRRSEPQFGHGCRSALGSSGVSSVPQSEHRITAPIVQTEAPGGVRPASLLSPALSPPPARRLAGQQKTPP